MLVCLFICVHVHVRVDVCNHTYGHICVCVFVFEYANTTYDFLFSYLSQSQLTALHLASQRGHHETVHLLLEQSAGDNSLDEVRVVYI